MLQFLSMNVFYVVELCLYIVCTVEINWVEYIVLKIVDI